MDLYFINHSYQYAVEQMLFTLFPGEKPCYPGVNKGGRRMELKLSQGESRFTATALYCDGDRSFRGRASAIVSALDGPLRRDSLAQQCLRMAMYRAVLRSGRGKPPWGALTGVRPGKLMTPLLKEEKSEKKAVKRFISLYDVSPERAELCLDASRYTLKAADALSTRDVCLYVGIPFCPTRCAYCSFVSQSTEKSLDRIPAFLDGLELELEALAEEIRRDGLRPVALYFGGGTPTTLSAGQLDRLLGRMEERFDLSEIRELTVEAGRPDTITEDRLKVLREHGVSRLSVNPQSMDNAVLQAIGRRHTAEDILKAMELVRKTGSFSVNMDLIAGLPADTEEGFCRSLDRVLALGAENITVHTLSIKKGARLRFGDELPGDREVAGMLDYACGRLRQEGYAPYYLYRQKNMSGGFENTGWTIPGHENLYNICIMEELCSILALGAGGSTKLIHPAGGRSERMIAPKYPEEYLAAADRLCKEKTRIGRFYEALGD